MFSTASASDDTREEAPAVRVPWFPPHPPWESRGGLALSRVSFFRDEDFSRGNLKGE
jgi:hypothetical protein